MSSYITELKHPETGKSIKAWCIDDYFGQHRYGYFFRKDGKNANWKDFDKLQEKEDQFDIFNEDEILI